MFACTLEVLRSVDWKVHVVSTLAACCFALNFGASLSEVVMAFVEMVAETFGTEPYIFALLSIFIGPYGV